MTHRLYWGAHEGPEPPFGICVTQSSLVYGVPPMYVTASLLWYQLPCRTDEKYTGQQQPYVL